MITDPDSRGTRVDTGVGPGTTARVGGGSATPPSAGWQPLAGPALLDRLRVTGRPRPSVDAALVGNLRGYLDRGLDDVAATVGGPATVVTGHRLTAALACGIHRPDDGVGCPPISAPLACGALVGVLFRQWVTTGSFDDPFDDALEGLSIDGHQAPVVAWIEGLSAARRSELRAEVGRQADGIRQRWPALDPAWLPRTREPIRVELAHGRVELAVRIDLVLGRPAVLDASVALVEVTSALLRPGHRDDARLGALAETLRSGAPPFAVATYSTRTGELDVEAVTPELLVGAANRLVAGVRAMIPGGKRSAAGAAPWCAGCAAELFRPAASTVTSVSPVRAARPAAPDVLVDVPEELAA